MSIKKSPDKFMAMLEIIPPKPRNAPTMAAQLKNWALLHPILAELNANEAGLNVLRQYMHVELTRAEGPRDHIMDRLYKRFSNLRRNMETAAMAALLPQEEAAA